MFHNGTNAKRYCVISLSIVFNLSADLPSKIVHTISKHAGRIIFSVAVWAIFSFATRYATKSDDNKAFSLTIEQLRNYVDNFTSFFFLWKYSRGLSVSSACWVSKRLLNFEGFKLSFARILLQITHWGLSFSKGFSHLIKTTF